MWFFAALTSVSAGRAQADDVGLVTRAGGGDEGALASLYDAHGRAVYSLALRVLGNEADAEEVLQEVFTQVWRQASRYERARGSVIAWLLTMARTRAIDRLRARRARPDSSVAGSDEATADLAAAPADPGDALGAARDAERVREAVQGLPLLQRLAIELAYFEGLTQSEIAERLEQPLGTVKTRIRLGLLKLREALGETVAGGTA